MSEQPEPVPQPTSAPCCAVTRRLCPDAVARVDAALAQLGQPGAVKLAQIAAWPEVAAVGLSTATLSKHRTICRAHAPAPHGVAATLQPGNAVSYVFSQSPQPLPPPPSPAEVAARQEQRAAAEHVRTIANLIAASAWKPAKHVPAMAERWGIPVEEVRRLHAVAALRVKSDRGTPTAQRELSIARVTKTIEEEQAAAATYDKAAEEAFRDGDARRAHSAKRLAGTARLTALAAEKYIGSITFQRPKEPQQIVNVTFSTNPDFTAAWAVVARVLELVAPGVSGRVEEALAAWEDRGEAGFAEWLQDQQEPLLLERGADGSYSAGEAVA